MQHIRSPPPHAAFATLFVVAIAFNRLDWTITKDDRWQEAQKAERLATVMQTISAAVEGGCSWPGAVGTVEGDGGWV